MTVKIIKLPQVIEITALSRASIYSFISQNTFPRPILLGKRAVGWKESEVTDWIDKKAEERK